MSEWISDTGEWNTRCPGLLERDIVPILLSSLSTTELCLMFYIEKSDQNILYRSRNCDREIAPKCEKKKLCENCQKLFKTLSHFHHLYLNVSCSQYKFEHGVEDEDEEKKPKYKLNNDCSQDGSQDFYRENEGGSKDFEGKDENGSQDFYRENESGSKDFEGKDENGSQDLSNENVDGSQDFSVDFSNENPDMKLYKTFFTNRVSITKSDNNDEESNTKSINSVKCEIRKYEKLHLEKPIGNHKQKHQNELTFSCHAEDCNKSFLTKERLDKHTKLGHRKTINCSVEGCEYISTGQYFPETRRKQENHMKELHPEIAKKRTHCPFCNVHFEMFNPGNMSRHLSVYHGALKDTETYKELKELDEKEFQYVCHECGKTFPNTVSLNGHRMEFHNMPKPTKPKPTKSESKEGHLCVECNKTFIKKDSFTQHIETVHCEGSEVKCSECDKSFKSFFHLKIHVRRNHKNPDHVCNQCGKAFKVKLQLTKHVKVVHDKVRAYGCEKCQYKGSSIFNFNLHRKKMHQMFEPLTRIMLRDMIMKGDHPFCGQEFLPLLQYDIGTSDTFIGRESHVIDNNKIKSNPEEA